MSKKLAGVGGGTGNSIQAMPLVPGQQESTAGADDIDTSDMTTICIFGDCDLYVESDTGNTLPVEGRTVFTVEDCESIHVSAAVKYTWV